nr:MAG TPA: hypothetical protein [Caudoviricetes sp.]
MLVPCYHLFSLTFYVSIIYYKKEKYNILYTDNKNNLYIAYLLGDLNFKTLF